MAHFHGVGLAIKNTLLPRLMSLHISQPRNAVPHLWRMRPRTAFISQMNHFAKVWHNPLGTTGMGMESMVGMESAWLMKMEEDFSLSLCWAWTDLHNTLKRINIKQIGFIPNSKHWHLTHHSVVISDVLVTCAVRGAVRLLEWPLHYCVHDRDPTFPFANTSKKGLGVIVPG